MRLGTHQFIQHSERPRLGPLGLVVADASAAFRSAVAAAVGRNAAFDVLEARSAAELAAVVGLRRPELALVDADLPPDGGVAAIATIAPEATRVVLWSLEPDPTAVVAGIRAGAAGFLEKNTHPAALYAALTSVARGENVLSDALTSAVLGEIQAAARRERLLARTSTLSRREHDILALIADGLPNREIASQLSISEFTVKRHVHNILRKLGHHSRATAAALFREATAAERTTVVRAGT